ncbi:MAG TPA: transcriptional coactivator p15/PC4 family protein [Spirochaetota bacterium]|nr:transcriptional coactivator p15/PC4 family protein [Spirochaetota bacterium]
MADETKQLAVIGVDENGFPTMREPIKIELSAFKKSKYLDVRKYFEKDGALCPTQKGIAISNEETFLKILEILNNNKTEIIEWIRAGKE